MLLATFIAAALGLVPPTDLPVEGSVRLRVSSPQQPKLRRVFSASKILDLRLEATFPPLHGDHQLEVRVFAPSGHLYQVLTVPFSSAPTSPRQRRVEGHPRPLEVRKPAKVMVDGEALQAVAAVLPVAGTWVVSSSLYGRWRAEARLDGSPEAQAIAAFMIEE